MGAYVLTQSVRQTVRQSVSQQTVANHPSNQPFNRTFTVLEEHDTIGTNRSAVHPKQPGKMEKNRTDNLLGQGCCAKKERMLP